MLRLAWPNILVMLVQASTGLIETWFVSRLGTDALAGMALVFPGFMMMQMLSAGAIGGGISSAIARALGRGRRADADALVLHAIIVNVALGIVCSVPVLVFGPSLYRALGGEGASLEAALSYSNVVFAGVVLVWLVNALASVLRGTGNMLVPSVAICAGVALLVPLSPCLIFGFGPIPALGIAGGGIAVVVTTALTAAGMAWYIWSGRGVVRPRLSRLRQALFIDILRVGAVGSISTLQTTLVFALTTALVGAAGGTGRCRRIRNRCAPGVFAHPFGFRSGRAAGGAGRHQYRCRPASTGSAHRPDRRRARLCIDRSDRAGCRGVAACLAGTVRQRSLACSKPELLICASSGRPTVSSGWVWLSTSLRRARGDCSGLC